MAPAAPGDADLAATQTRLEALLDPYRDRLEAFEIYGVPMLRRPGAKAHDWFAGVNRGNGVVRFSFLPMHAHPELLDELSPAVRKRKSGASLFTFKTVDDETLGELERLLARGFKVYWPEGAADGG
ncbi:MAG TPA: hypothetical protein VFO05_00275 [Candidatus Limnocylindrales bacterium]|nr:hypothetical protein [Candidatus Limnocylindrales bacterium]